MYVSEGFSHRRNADGSLDSICHKCFRTVASTLSEPDLELAEKKPTATGVRNLSEMRSGRISNLMISRWKHRDLRSREVRVTNVKT